MPEDIRTALTVVAALGVVTISAAAALHALLRKSEPRSALGWVVFCVLFPLVGGIVYWLIGSNRITTRARKLRGRFGEQPSGPGEPGATFIPTELPHLVDRHGPMGHIALVGDRVTRRPLTPGNSVEPLVCGEQAYPAMLEAIDAAEHTVHLLTYLFDGPRTRERFVGALGRARDRGVTVRVLLDGVGEFYGRPRAGVLLRRRGVEVARFLPPSLSSRGVHVNLRNHRKVLVVDGMIGFTGGMNLRDDHEVEHPDTKYPVRDLHFRVRGPVVADLERVFLEDWEFASGQRGLEPRVPDPPRAGGALCRVVADGPNEDFDALRWLLLGAIGTAHRRVWIVTPYFLPESDMIAALIAASLRGVDVRVLVPGTNNQWLVAWASRALAPELLAHGVRIREQPPPFAHTKGLIVDEGYGLVGSANLDQRSLRLNFELGLEVFDTELVGRTAEVFERRWDQARELTIEELAQQSLAVRVRDNLARLLSPYL